MFKNKAILNQTIKAPEAEEQHLQQLQIYSRSKIKNTKRKYKNFKKQTKSTKKC